MLGRAAHLLSEDFHRRGAHDWLSTTGSMARSTVSLAGICWGLMGGRDASGSTSKGSIDGSGCSCEGCSSRSCDGEGCACEDSRRSCDGAAFSETNMSKIASMRDVLGLVRGGGGTLAGKTGFVFAISGASKTSKQGRCFAAFCLFPFRTAEAMVDTRILSPPSDWERNRKASITFRPR